MRRLLSLTAAGFLATAAIAQDASNTILVLDGSGSMWGQIDGVNKIVIAREVVGTLLDDFPTDQNLGLTVYGHRERGSCTDIETVVPPGGGTLDAIRDAVNGINPRGKTPMTDAVIAAAEALRFTEEKATVILVSDGIETCNPDPCAAARALEEAGIDFTAHVVGFDVTDPEALAQMQCLAGETGGTFLTASNASELTDALVTVAVAPEPDPVPQTIRIAGVLVPGGPEIQEPIDWALVSGEAGTGPGYSLGLDGGDYFVTGTRVSDGAEASAGFSVAVATQDTGARIEVVFPEPAPDPVDVTFRAVIGDVNGPEITEPVLWDITGADGALAEGTPGNPLVLEMVEGSYTLDAYWTAQETAQQAQFVVVRDPRTITVVFEPPAITATVTAPASAPLGSTIEVGWNGPNLELDYVGIGPVDAKGADLWDNWTYTKDGNPLQLLMPVEPGPHKIQYFLGDGREPIGEAMIEVTDIEKSLTLADTATAGSTIEVGWVGPDYENDYIGIGRVGAKGADLWENWTYTNKGNPTELLVPVEPGDYVVRYFLAQDRHAIVEAALTVVDVQASIIAPSEATIGETLDVGWTGPDYENDYIGIGKVDASGAAVWENWTYTREGAPLSLLMPEEPGEYVIRYFLGQDREPLAESAITLAAVAASVTAPTEATVGSTVEVGWSGPDYDNDYIGVGKVGADGARAWENFWYTRNGNPAELMMPTEPGDYEIQYFLAQGRTPIAKTAITLGEVQASVTAPSEANVGSIIEVGWTGPDYDNDYVGIGKVGASGSREWENFTYTNVGNPLELVMPTEPGDYLISYFLAQDRTPIATSAITLSAVQASVTAPSEALAGSMIEVGWTGPGYDRDYVAIGKVDATGSSRWEAYGYTKDGETLTLQVPTEPGDYLVRYFEGQDRTILSEVPLTVTAVSASLTAPASAALGSTVEVGWTGPNYQRDYVGIGRVGATGSGKWEQYQRTSEGDVLTIQVPSTPGEYEITYYLGQDRSKLETIPFTVEPVEVSLVVPASAAPGDEIEIGWSGPAYQRDFIAMGLKGKTGSAQWVSSARIDDLDGAPVTLTVPETPGTYVVRYYLGLDRTILAAEEMVVE